VWGWVKHCFRNYAAFGGRAGRPEYWWFYLFTLLCSLVLYIVTTGAPGSRVTLRGLFWLATIIPSLAVTSRRLHDTDHSFWWALAPLFVVAPLAGLSLAYRGGLAARGNHLAGGLGFLMVLAVLGVAVWVLILLCRAGDAGANRFGEPAPTTPG
jgi:uncharacterized membrane protein YhaH (DUF805 family)